jgi:hypothetical protein
LGKEASENRNSILEECSIFYINDVDREANMYEAPLALQLNLVRGEEQNGISTKI